MTNIAAYGEGYMYPPTINTYSTSIQQAGWDTLIVGLFHINDKGDIGFNSESIISNQTYVGDSNWPKALAELVQQGSTIQTLVASIGGGGVSDFANIQTIYNNNGQSFSGTALESNFKAFQQALPNFSIIDMDCEEAYDQDSFVAFCQMLIGLGYGITFCPYATWEVDFWVGSLQSLEQSNPGAVQWWNLQCYDGGGGNTPDQWAGYITSVMPDFNTNGFIWAGDWSRNYNSNAGYWQGNCPPATQSLFQSFKAMSSLGGGFIWTIDQILDYADQQKSHPDPNPCGTITQQDYIAAIKNGLS